MILSDFRRTHSVNLTVYSRADYAMVKVTTGMWFWKKTVTRQICCKVHRYWFFTDNGQSVPDSQIQALVRAYDIRG